MRAKQINEFEQGGNPYRKLGIGQIDITIGTVYELKNNIESITWDLNSRKWVQLNITDYNKNGYGYAKSGYGYTIVKGPIIITRIYGGTNMFKCTCFTLDEGETDLLSMSFEDAYKYLKYKKY